MAAIAYSEEARHSLNRLAAESSQTAFRLMNRLYSWANRTPPIPSDSTHLGYSMSSAYRRKCYVDNREFLITFIYPHGIQKQFKVVNVIADLDSKDDVIEDDIYELDN